MENYKSGNEPIYTIDQISKITNLSKPTIRYYEDIELLSNVFRDKNNIRLFSDNNISRLKTIQCMRGNGFGIKLIRHYFDQDSVELKERYLMLLDQEKLLLEKKEELEKQLAFIQHNKLEFEKELKLKNK
ncbi:MerR family transcriptional regulator [uncultured Clostridium sp.]|uniref:MerR family transcriptional regulator n=1 Tax=uncultured Clostridium sp. TaxID=59620 RepID=UPI0028E671D2|nr:MerR family transcriptional regulator [uncultured Clostridium sp.]